MSRHAWQGFAVFAFMLATACGTESEAAGPCAAENAGLTVPAGFCVQVVADGVGRARHLAVAPNGDLLVAIGGEGGGVLALRDTTGDGRADVRTWFARSAVGGTGLELAGDALYFGADDAVVRYPYRVGALEPAGPPDTIVRDLPAVRSHRAKSLALGPDGRLFVNVGSPSNACQQQDRTAGSPGIDPCPELATRAGVWRFDARRSGQTQAEGERFATGLRNTVALAIGPRGALYGLQHGRDQLVQNWPDLYDERRSAESPGEEFVRIERGDDYGWPYCYYDVDLGKKVLTPEYGGDGQKVGRCANVKSPILVFPGHWAPNDLLFYEAGRYPARYRGGAFIAFHGSWNRAPLPQEGYKVVFVPFANGRPAGEYETFADGFAGDQKDPREAEHRPTGLAVGPDGSLYVSDDRGGRLYRIHYVGSGS
ncbi:MAG: PQQ-dependent sugar dehydrogenase [Gemmatimonadota bacterium]